MWLEPDLAFFSPVLANQWRLLPCSKPRVHCKFQGQDSREFEQRQVRQLRRLLLRESVGVGHSCPSQQHLYNASLTLYSNRIRIIGVASYLCQISEIDSMDSQGPSPGIHMESGQSSFGLGGRALRRDLRVALCEDNICYALID